MLELLLAIDGDSTADGQRFVILNDVPQENRLIGLIENWAFRDRTKR